MVVVLNNEGVLSYTMDNYIVVIEIDFFVLNRDLTWHVLVHFYTKQDKLIKTLHFKKENMHLRDALKEVYYETNNDILIRTRIERCRIPAVVLEDSEYISFIYPGVAHMRRAIDRKLTNYERGMLFKNTKFI